MSNNPSQDQQAPNSANIAQLLTALESEETVVRERAREALEALGRPAVEPLIKVLSDERAHVRWEAAKTLAEIGDPAAAPALVSALEDENSDIRWLAAEGLIAIGRDGLVPLLQALLKHADSIWLRDGAHHVLRELSDQELRPVLAPLLAALKDIAATEEVPSAAEAALSALQ